MEVDQTEMSAILGVTAAALSRWSAQGCPRLPERSNGDSRRIFYDPRSVIEWRTQQEIARLQIRDSRDAYFEERARREKLMRLRDEGTLINPAQIGPAMRKYIEDTMRDIEALAESYGPRFLETTSVDAATALLTKMVREIRLVLGSYEFQPTKNQRGETDDRQIEPTALV
jgi:hypothetical protein